MFDAINDSLRRFADYRGRSNRLQYNGYVLFYMLMNLFISVANPKAITLNTVLWALSMVPMISVQVRRSHDVGRSGWWILIPLYPLYLMFAKSIPEVPNTSESSL